MSRKTLNQVFARTVADAPEAVAVLDGARTLNYAELDAWSTAIAARLVAAGVGRGARVGLMVDRGVMAVLGILGILRAGACYVPLDPHYPAERLRLLCEDSAPAMVITDGSGAPPEGVPCIELAPQPEAEAGVPPPDREVRPEDPAYVIYTSGSTGRPKGVVVTHANVVSLLEGSGPLFDFRRDDRWTLFHSYSFDFSVWEMWMPFAVGASLVTVPLATARSSEDFLDLLLDRGVTVLNQVPSVFRFLVDELAFRDAPGLALRYVIFGGEAVDVGVIAEFRAAAPGAEPTWVNMYGITETTVHVTHKVLEPADLVSRSASPIGRPLPHLEIHLLDESGQAVGGEETGEMWVSGGGVAAGYLNQPDLTAERFVQLSLPEAGEVRCYRTGDLARRRADGEFEYVGRADDQVKVRGFRIELGEIEHALGSLPGVAEASVVVLDAPAGPLLAAVVVRAADGEEPSSREVCDHVAALLPAHMVPSRILFADSLPLAPSGKLDRRETARLADRLSSAR